VLAANNVTQQQMGPFHHWQGVILAACVRFMFGKTSLARFLFVYEISQELLNGSGLNSHEDVFGPSLARV